MQAQTSTTANPKTTHKRVVKKKTVRESATEREIRELREQMQSQQAQIDSLKQQNAEKDAKLATTSQDAQAANAAAAQATAQAAGVSSSVQANTDAVNDLKATNVALTQSMSETKKNVTGLTKMQDSLSDLAHGKVKIGATFFADYAYYPNTGFGPQFLTQMNQDGPGNGGFNSLDVTRTYINFYYTPNDAITLRLTPNIYRQVDVSNAVSNGSGSGIASSSNGNLGFRLKYAYVDFNTLFNHSKALSKDKLTFGQTTNPLVDWEEGLYGYRYVNLVPWNYLSLSSTYTGVTLHGPIMVNGKEYLDYHIGVFNTASFHSIETNDKKQVMGRVTWYPFGTKSDRTGLGVTAFENYGYNTKTPDAKSTPLNRVALLVHYQSSNKAYLIAGEYDLGHNAFSTGNLFSGAGPADLIGLGPTKYAPFADLSSALLAGTHTRQQGFDLFGHAKLGHTPLAVFGTYQHFQPNTRISGDNPVDFQRIVAGISYKFNDHFDLAVDSQNLIYTNSQFTMTPSQIATFSPSLALKYPAGIAKAVPDNTNALFVNMQYNF